MAKSPRHYSPTETDDGQDERFLKPINDASRQNVAGFMDDLLALAEVPDDDPEALAAWKYAIGSGKTAAAGE
jgi:hypothetical protein